MTPCDWDQESRCVEPGCGRPATHAMTVEIAVAPGLAELVGDGGLVEIVELVCADHAAEVGA